MCRSEWQFKQSGKWTPFLETEREHFLALPAATALMLLDGNIPVVIKRGSNFICSGNILDTVKAKHKRVAAMAHIAASIGTQEITFRDLLEG